MKHHFPLFGLKRLPIEAPEFTQVSWVSDTARDLWRPRLKRIAAAWSEIEWRSVVEGLRRCCATIVPAPQLPKRAGTYARHGLAALPVCVEGLRENSYSNTSVEAVIGMPFGYRVVVGKPIDAAAFHEAWDQGDQLRVGELLGYPMCCTEFFQRVWVDYGFRDTTWPMAYWGTKDSNKNLTIEVEGPPECNILWRWMGVRCVSHLPCRFDCDRTLKVGRAMTNLGRRLGYAPEMDWLLEMLDWPAEWSASSGVAHIRTPLLRVAASTDATTCTHVVRRRGRGQPIEAKKRERASAQPGPARCVSSVGSEGKVEASNVAQRMLRREKEKS